MKDNYMKLVAKAADTTDAFYEAYMGDVYITLDRYRILRLMPDDYTIADLDYLEDHFKYHHHLHDLFEKYTHDITALERGAKGKMNSSVHLYGKHKVVADRMMRLLPKDVVYSVDDMRTPVYLVNDDMYPVVMIMPCAYLADEFERAFPAQEVYD